MERIVAFSTLISTEGLGQEVTVEVAKGFRRRECFYRNPYLQLFLHVLDDKEIAWNKAVRVQGGKTGLIGEEETVAFKKMAPLWCKDEIHSFFYTLDAHITYEKWCGVWFSIMYSHIPLSREPSHVYFECLIWCPFYLYSCHPVLFREQWQEVCRVEY